MTAIFELEMEYIWGKAWIYIGHESQVPDPGSYVTLQLGKFPEVIACGGSWLTPADEVKAGNYAGITRLAREALAVAATVRD